jgi:hypothetical protein
MAKRQGTADRGRRKEGGIGGVWATSSQDLVHLVQLLYGHSKAAAAGSIDGNWSRYVYAGLPMLLAALQAFVVEYERMSYPGRTSKILDINSSEFKTTYRIDGPLLQDFEALSELRNEIIHPAHLPTGSKDNWPDYLRHVKSAGLLNTTNDPDSDYTMFPQMGSHKLFTWAVNVTREIYKAVIESDPKRAERFRPFLESWSSEQFGGR